MTRLPIALLVIAVILAGCTKTIHDVEVRSIERTDTIYRTDIRRDSIMFVERIDRAGDTVIIERDRLRVTIRHDTLWRVREVTDTIYVTRTETNFSGSHNRYLLWVILASSCFILFVFVSLFLRRRGP